MMAKRKRGWLQEMVAAIESTEGAEPNLIPPIVPLQDEGPPITNKMIEIIRILRGNLLLPEPTLNWLYQKEAELASAQLAVLFTPEELAAKRKTLERDNGSERKSVLVAP